MPLRLRVATVAALLAVAAPACLSATPPKTSNQRDAERHAPHVTAPPPPDAGRRPRPADTDDAPPSLAPPAPTRQ